MSLITLELGWKEDRSIQSSEPCNMSPERAHILYMSSSLIILNIVVFSWIRGDEEEKPMVPSTGDVVSDNTWGE